MFKRIVMITVMCLISARVEAGQVGVSAAASLKEALGELVVTYERLHPDARIVRNFGASGTLAKQIESGAPADIFISANGEWANYLKEKGLAVQGSVVPFAYNSLVFVGQGGTKVAEMNDLVGLERIAIGSPRSVPAGEYAMEALKRSGMDKRLANKLVMARDVRDCLMYAERGEVDGAFVYRTDALLARKAKILFTVPADLHGRVAYPMALTTSGAKNASAEDFYRFLRSSEARAVLEKYGFTVR